MSGDIYDRIFPKPNDKGLIVPGGDGASLSPKADKEKAKLAVTNKSEMDVKQYIDYDPNNNRLGLTFQIRIRRVPCDAKGKPLGNRPPLPWIMLPAFGLRLKDMQRITKEMEAEALKNRPDWAAEYYAKHSFCPTCGQLFPKWDKTYEWLDQQKDTMADTTRVECPCGWKGTLHQLKDTRPNAEKQ